MEDIVSIILLVFVILVIIACILVDILRNDHNVPIRFRLRRFLNWFSLGLAYSSMYIGRYNFTLLTNERITKDIGLSESSYGWVLSIGFWTYAVCAPISGSIGDYIGAKPVVFVGVLGSGIVNVLLGVILLCGGGHVIPPTLLFGFFNAINFISQSLATGSINKINSGWYRKCDLGVFGGIFSAILATAFFFTFNVGNGILKSSLPWSFLFIIPGSLLIIFSLFILFIVKEKPHQAGWGHLDFSPPTLTTPSTITSSDSTIPSHSIQDDQYEDHNNIEMNNIILLNQQHLTQTNNIDHHDHDDHHNDNNQLLNDQDNHDNENENEKENSNNNQNINYNNQQKQSFWVTLKSIIKEVVSKENIQPIVCKENILNALSLFCSGWIKEGFISWFILFLSNRFPNTSPSLLSISSAGVSVGAMTGGMLCGLLSDFAFNSKRSPSLFIFYLFMNILIVILYFISNDVIATLVLFLSLILIFGTNNMLAVTALLDLGAVRNASLMAGLLTTFQYVASGFSGFLLGYIVENWGFGAWLMSMLPFGIAAMLMMAYTGVNDLLFWRKWNKIHTHDQDISIKS